MAVSPDIISQLLSLAPSERFTLAQRLLDSIDDCEAARSDEELLAELRRRRDDMLRGEQAISDWRSSLSGIEASLSR